MAKRTYEEAAHAMQTGVKLMRERGSRETEPYSLRVGVNSAMVDTAAIASLLIKKGIFTREEFMDELTEQMNAEADRYEKEISDRSGANITLH